MTTPAREHLQVSQVLPPPPTPGKRPRLGEARAYLEVQVPALLLYLPESMLFPWPATICDTSASCLGNKMDNLEEMDIFLEKFNLPRAY